MRGKRIFRKTLVTVLMAIITAFSPINALALTPSQLEMFSQNNILFYDPAGKVKTCFGTLSGSTLYEKVLSFLLSIGLNEIGASGVYGNMMREGLGSGQLLSHEDGVDSRSDIGTWYSAATYYGPNGLYVQEKDVRDLDDPSVMHGLGFIQWSFGRRVNLLKALADAGGLDQYAREWDDASGRYVYDGMTYDQLVESIGQDTTDGILTAELEFFNSEHQGYNVTQDDIDAQGLAQYGVTRGMGIFEALNLVSTPEEAAELFYTTSEMPGATRFNSTGEARASSARDGYDLMVSAGIIASGATACGEGGGSIVETALALAWNRETEGRHDKSDPKPEYEQAMHQVGTWWPGGPCGSDGSCAPNGASCDVFVATVMRYSGSDPDFPTYGPTQQREHMMSHPEMYEEIENLQDVSNLQAGDIFVVDNASGKHIFIYMGLVDGKWMQASASFNGRTGEYFEYQNYTDYGELYRIFRRI